MNWTRSALLGEPTLVDSSVGTFSVTALCRSLQRFSRIGSHYNVLAYSEHIRCVTSTVAPSIYVHTDA